MTFAWKQISTSVISSGDSKLMQKVREAEECLRHSLMRNLFTSPYRSYRRGKNRCKLCGAKLNVD